MLKLDDDDELEYRNGMQKLKRRERREKNKIFNSRECKNIIKYVSSELKNRIDFMIPSDSDSSVSCLNNK